MLPIKRQVVNHFFAGICLVIFLIGLAMTDFSYAFANTTSDQVYQSVYQSVYESVYQSVYPGQTPSLPPVVEPKPPQPPATVPKPTVPKGELVKPSIVWAKTVQAGRFFIKIDGTKEAGTFPQGATVKLIRDRNLAWYNIEYNGKRGWAKRNLLKIPPDPPTNPQRMTKAQLEAFVNSRGFSSATSMLIWTDIDRQLTYVFTGKRGKWNLRKVVAVSTGRNDSPTIRGTFKIQNKGKGFNVGGGGKVIKVTQFFGPYKFHSIVLSYNGKILDGTLNKRASHGCIRMAVADASWFYNNVPINSAVWVN